MILLSNTASRGCILKQYVIFIWLLSPLLLELELQGFEMLQKFSLEREHMKLLRTRSEKNKTNRTKRTFGISLHYQIKNKDFAIASDTQKRV